MSGQGCEQLMLYPEGSHASLFPLPGSAEAQRMTVTSGLKCLELYRKSGPLGLLVKMLLGSSQWRSTRCYLTWKPSGTPARRLLFRLVPSTPRTDVTDVQLLPTMTVFDATCGDLKGKEYDGKTRHAMKLIQAITMWPTPKATDYKRSGPAGSKSAEHDLHKGNLKGTVMYATPQARDYRTGQVGRWQKPKKSRNLNDQAGGQLNPTWVEWFMGFTTGWTDLNV